MQNSCMKLTRIEGAQHAYDVEHRTNPRQDWIWTARITTMGPAPREVVVRAGGLTPNEKLALETAGQISPGTYYE